MTPKLRKALLNNIALYRAVFAAQGIEPAAREDVFYTTREVPPYYSNLVTLGKDWKPDGVLEEISRSAAEQGWKEWSIKDSFNLLDLKPLGFSRLFAAQWLYLSSQQFVPAKKEKKLAYEVIRSAPGLSAWLRAWGSEEIGKKIFHPELLQNPDLYFIAGYEKNSISAGCLLNRSGDVFGLSNFFAPEQAVSYRSGLISFIHDWIEALDIVGYEQSPGAEALQDLGFVSAGKLAVWLKKN